MANIELSTSGFRAPFTHLNGFAPLPVSYREFLRASLTLGFQQYSTYCGAGPDFAFYRWSLGIASGALLRDNGGQLVLSAAHAHLDASEKGAMSYWQAMIFTKLVAAKKLGVPWLAHLDGMLRTGFATTTATSNRRCDFAGRDAMGRWHVLESKGRSSTMETGLVNDAKQQAANVRFTAVPQPVTHSACVSCLWTKPILVVFDDPPANDGKADAREIQQWTFDEAAFWRHYYGGLVRYIREIGSPRIRESGYRFAPITLGMGFRANELFVGLPEEVVEQPLNAPKVLRVPKLEGSGDDLVVLEGETGEWPQIQETNP